MLCRFGTVVEKENNDSTTVEQADLKLTLSDCLWESVRSGLDK